MYIKTRAFKQTKIYGLTLNLYSKLGFWGISAVQDVTMTPQYSVNGFQHPAFLSCLPRSNDGNKKVNKYENLIALIN